MPSVASDHGVHESNGSEAVLNRSCCQQVNPRPQRLNAWFNLIPVNEFEASKSEKVLFLDSFVTIETKTKKNGSTKQSFIVRWEGEQEMCSVVQVGVIFVWYGEDLSEPDRPFPKLYDELYPMEYVSSKPVVFDKTHIMDFIENGSDNLHFRVVHLWESSKMYDHVITEDTITLKQDTKFRYGACSNSAFTRFMSKILPKLELTHDYVYHGPTMAVVGAEGMGSPEMHALVSLTPVEEHRTRVYVTMALAPTTFPKWAEKAFHVVSPKRSLCDLLAKVMANYIKNEFDVDAMIWKNKKYTRKPTLLPVEKHLGNVIRWGETFYPKDFKLHVETVKPEEEKQWETLDDVASIEKGKVLPYSVAGEELIAFKDEEGEVHVYGAYCPHQGAHLGRGGKLENDAVRCPFHGFYFDKKGRCIGPNPENRNKFISNLNLDPIKYRIEDGIVEVFV